MIKANINRTRIATLVRYKLVAIAFFAIVIPPISLALGQGQHTWIGVTDGVFSDASKWVPAHVPSDLDTAVFGNDFDYSVDFLNNRNIANLDIFGSGDLRFRALGMANAVRQFTVNDSTRIFNESILTLQPSAQSTRVDLNTDYLEMNGHMEVLCGSSFDAHLVDVARGTGSSGYLLVSGTTNAGNPTSWNASVLDIWNQGTFTVQQGAMAFVESRINVGRSKTFGFDAALIVDATDVAGNPSMIATNLFQIGGEIDGLVQITNGGQIHSNHLELVNGSITVNGSSGANSPSSWSNTDDMTIGSDFSHAFLTIENGGFVDSQHSFVLTPDNQNHQSRIVVKDINNDGNRSTWINREGIEILDSRMNIDDGAIVISETGFVDDQALVEIDGSNAGISSTWEVNGLLTIGSDVYGSVEVKNDGNLVTGTTILGAQANTSVPSRLIINEAGWNNVGNLFIGGNHTVAGTPSEVFVNLGSVVEIGGTMKIYPDSLFDLEDSFLSVQVIDNSEGEFSFDSGTLQVSAFQGNLFNPQGVLSPGPGTDSTTIVGDYIQLAEASLALEIGGVDPGISYDRVVVTGAASVGGEFEIEMVDGFQPNPTDVFTVLSSNSLSGFFSNVTSGERLFTSDGTGSFLVHYGPFSAFDSNSIVLTQFQNNRFLLGDLNGDGVVDLLDVQPFVDLITSGVYQIVADINSDGSVDLLDIQPFVELLVG